MKNQRTPIFVNPSVTNPNPMKPVRLALFAVLLIFHIIVVALSLQFSQSLADGIVRDPSAFRFLALFGLGVFLITFAFGWFDRWTARKKIERLEAEKDRIKAEVFDREQRAREREREIDQEISSFQQSLPEDESTATLNPTASRAVEPHLIDPPDDAPSLAQPKPDETDEVEYAPLKPKPSGAFSDLPPADDADPDTNPFRP